ncbi:MAG: Coenzyme F420 hydrogenase/dehydrogenase, beta subunit C-terminal domain [Lachnospiraceae bacterium]|nr:Coenzyme F420 hydrogenase/dehydrogenase, beta subunit C-terminal domain [Lachnospiraceae bacterium]
MYENVSFVKEHCFGCRSCEQVCSIKCIDMKANAEGFLYPGVNEAACIHCGRCVQSCPAEQSDLHRNRPFEMYGIKSRDEKAVMNSASGGAADAAARSIILEGGVVFGAAYNEKQKVMHIEVDQADDLYRIQSSKYVQSDLAECYSRAKEYLKEGRKVLFTGTPCQIAGLYSFLGKEYGSLYTLDLICHGVPSPLFFEKYNEFIEKKMGGKVLEYNFRSKERKGWGTQLLLKIRTRTDARTQLFSLSRYGRHFLDGDCYRMSCYQCPFADMKRCGDLTAGDYWGINRYNPEMFSEKGVSSVGVNTEKGKELLNKMNIEAVPIKEEAFLEKQDNLKHPTPMPDSRKTFYVNVSEENFIDSIKVGILLKERIKALIPAKVFVFLKKIRG